MTIENIVKIVNKVLRPWKNRILLTIGRGILMAVNDSKSIQQVQVTLLADEVKDQVESMGHFGLASNPPKNSDVIMVSVGSNRDHGVIIATESRDSRFKGLTEGNTAIYNKNEKYIHLKDDDIEMLVSKLKVSNDNHELIAVISEWMDEVRKGLVTTAIGPQTWTAPTKVKLDAVKVKLDTFKA